VRNGRVVDAHQHFWNPRLGEYPWMTGHLASLGRVYEPDDLAPLLDASGIDGTIVVQARHALAETDYLLSLADRTPWVVGVVGWVDLTAGDVAETIHGIIDGPRGSHLVGVRHQVHDEPDPDWLLRSDVLDGLRAVEECGLAFDLLVRQREMPAALELARRLPGLRLVLDHMGKPRIVDGDVEPWRSLVTGFHNAENVVCKVSGLITEADWSSWRVEHLSPFVGVAVEVFGPDRLMFGSDWPVCLLAGSYADVYEAAVRTLRAHLGDDIAAALGGCAMRVYLGANDGE
jgi:L-fuconolactonase